MSPLFTEESEIDRETILDITVNVIPIAILAVFITLYLFINPFGYDAEIVIIQQFLKVMPLVGLAILTYLSARIIARDEKHGEVHHEDERPDEEV